MTSESLKPLIVELIGHFGTQKKLAVAAKVSQPAVSQWLNEINKPDRPALINIQKASKGKYKARKIRPELF